MTAAAPATSDATAPSGVIADPALRRTVLRWEIAGWLVVFFVGSFFHFIFELSGFSTIVAPFGSVNESTWEHLKLFYWPGLAFAIAQHAYLRHRVNNFWVAKAVSAVMIPASVAFLFYAYIGVVIPIDGKGTFLGTIVITAIAVTLGQVAAYRILVDEPYGERARRIAIAILVLMGVAFVVFTWAPPRIFLFENFAFYRYSGEFGILQDYTPYLVFK